MAQLPICQDGEAVLRTVATPIPEELFGSPELLRMLTDMRDTLDGEADGVALAAPQVGLPHRIFIVRYDRMHNREHEADKKTEPDVGIFINPEFVKTSRKREEMQEGCLSVRGIYGTTFRHERATVRAQDERGVWFTRGGGGILAQAYQHEIDHLNGTLFIDHAEELHEQTREDTETHGTEPA
jgi:peptide deformylase